jgi:hypothetical protein
MLHLFERESGLFGDHTTIEAWKGKDPVDYILKTMGDEISSVASLRINAILPDELEPGQWDGLKESFLFEVLCGRMTMLKKIEIVCNVPYTEESANACMMVRLLPFGPSA